VILAQEPWEVVRFPAIAEADEVHEVETILGSQRFTRRVGEALHPDREPLDTLDRLRRTIGEYNFAGQYSAISRPVGQRAGQGRMVQALSPQRIAGAVRVPSGMWLELKRA
jgi:hypothetical protein